MGKIKGKLDHGQEAWLILGVWAPQSLYYGSRTEPRKLLRIITASPRIGTIIANIIDLLYICLLTEVQMVGMRYGVLPVIQAHVLWNSHRSPLDYIIACISPLGKDVAFQVGLCEKLVLITDLYCSYDESIVADRRYIICYCSISFCLLFIGALILLPLIIVCHLDPLQEKKG